MFLLSGNTYACLSSRCLPRISLVAFYYRQIKPWTKIVLLLLLLLLYVINNLQKSITDEQHLERMQCSDLRWIQHGWSVWLGLRAFNSMGKLKHWEDRKRKYPHTIAKSESQWHWLIWSRKPISPFEMLLIVIRKWILPKEINTIFSGQKLFFELSKSHMEK